MLKTDLKTDLKADNEVYNRLQNIEKELNKYDPAVFKDKVIFCNVDDRRCNCWRFFHMNFHRLGLKKLIASYYKMDGSSSYDMLYDSKDPKDDIDVSKGTKLLLKGTGDFRSDDCASLLKQSDLVVGNLPSSLFWAYIAQLEQYTIPYNVLGTSAIICKSRFPLLKDEKTELWLFAA